MWELTIQTVTLAAVLTILGLCSYTFVGYIRLLHLLRQFRSAARKMECDDLIDQLLADAGTPAEKQESAGAPAEKQESAGAPVVASRQSCDQKRARLAAIAAGGTTKQYLGKQLTLSQVDDMTDDEVSKHYDRYEARLGSSMVKTLGASALQMYALAAGKFLPIPPENVPQLVSDLNEDPFVQHALTTACCELYHRCGMYIAPLTAAMTTAKHCRFGDRESSANMTAEDGGGGTARDNIEIDGAGGNDGERRCSAGEREGDRG